MRSAPFHLQGKGVLQVQQQQQQEEVFYWRDCVISNSSSSSISSTTTSSGISRKIITKKGEGLEPRSVLDNRRSPSPPTSTSTLSSSLGGGGGGGGSSDSAGVAAVSENTPTPSTHKWAHLPDAADIHPNIPSSVAALEIPPEKCSSAVDDWEAMLSESAASPGQEQTFLRWIMGDLDDPSSAAAAAVSLPFADPPPPFSAPPPQPPLFPNSPKVPTFSTNNNNPITPNFFFPSSVPNNPLPMFFQEPIEEKPQSHHLFNPGILLNQSSSPQNPSSFFLPFQPDHLLHLPPQLPFRPSKPKDEAAAAAQQQQQQQQSLVDHLSKAAELLESGHPTSAREILARLNHHLPSSPIALKPLLRSAFYFKETLLHLLLLSNPIPTATPTTTTATTPTTPWEIVLKLSSYKDFSEVSPLLHFANFTSTQTLLEDLHAADRIHLVDFDIGIGGHWSSFMQELAHRRSPAVPFLKVTAFVNPSSFHPLELHLTRDNLSQFAADLNIPFEFTFLSIESFDPLELLAVGGSEAIAVNLPIGSHYSPPFPTLLRLVKQLNPKIVVSVDHCCDRGDLPFSHHFLHAFQSCVALLDSIDAAGTNSDVAGKIERFIVQPRIENAVLGRYRSVEKMLPWRTLFASTGFVPVQFSNFTETQAECLLKRVQVRGFHVEKRQASLFLYWQRGELGSVSAWRC